MKRTLQLIYRFLLFTKPSVSVSLSFLFVILLFAGCQLEREGEKEEGEEAVNGEQAYYEQSRRAALGDNWEAIYEQNQENRIRASQNRLVLRGSFAGGALQGDWYERGSSNIAGSLSVVHFYPATDSIYAISQSQTLVKGGLTGGAWTVLNDREAFDARVLAVVPIAGGKRIVTARKGMDKRLFYSDNEGKTWTAATGVDNNAYVTGGAKNLIVLNNGVMFYLRYGYYKASSTTGFTLFRSADNGATWTTTKDFITRSDEKVAVWSPFGSNDLYLLDEGKIMYSLTGMATVLTAQNIPKPLTDTAEIVLSGYKNGANLTLYALFDSKNLFQSVNNGVTWTNISTLPKPAWEGLRLTANPWVANLLYYGEVSLFSSADAGKNWVSYRDNINFNTPLDRMHVDMMCIKPFQKTDGTKFLLIGNHGGLGYLPEPFNVTTNLTKTNCPITDYYDVMTIGGYIFAGAQDQGSQRFDGSAGTNVLSAQPFIGGDYTRLNSSVNGTKFWEIYPAARGADSLNGGITSRIHYVDDPFSVLTQNDHFYNIANVEGSSNKNVAPWGVPTCNWGNPAANSILVGGGSVVKDDTTVSNLIKMTYNGSKIVGTAYPFNFKTGTGVFITAVGHSSVDVNNMYVATNKGNFYYSKDGGATFTLSAGIAGAPQLFKYGSCLQTSKINKDLVFYSGKGGGVYKTTNGGASFSNMSTGMDSTFIHEMVLNANETLLFASTDNGPYVCVLNTGQWYSLATATTPIKRFRGVEYVANENVVRFATFGRGVWDFKITAQPVTAVSTPQTASDIAVFPTILHIGTPLSINGSNGTSTLQIFDLQGRTVLTEAITTANHHLQMPTLTSGIYVYAIREKNNQLVKQGKLMVL